MNWCMSRSPRDTLLHRLDTARTFEEWEDAAFQLDELMSTDLWFVQGPLPSSLVRNV